VNTERHQVSTVPELQAMAADANVRQIVISVPISDVPGLRLSRGQTLTGIDAQSGLHFTPGSHGLELSADNRVEGLQLVADPDKRAVFNDTGVDRLGRLVLRDLTVKGVVQLLARDQVRSGHVEVENIDIVAADARGYDERPKGYGVEVIPARLRFGTSRPIAPW
jgi:hypothetical protein